MSRVFAGLVLKRLPRCVPIDLACAVRRLDRVLAGLLEIHGAEGRELKSADVLHRDLVELDGAQVVPEGDLNEMRGLVLVELALEDGRVALDRGARSAGSSRRRVVQGFSEETPQLGRGRTAVADLGHLSARCQVQPRPLRERRAVDAPAADGARTSSGSP